MGLYFLIFWACKQKNIYRLVLTALWTAKLQKSFDYLYSFCNYFQKPTYLYPILVFHNNYRHQMISNRENCSINLLNGFVRPANLFIISAHPAPIYQDVTPPSIPQTQKHALFIVINSISFNCHHSSYSASPFKQDMFL